MRNESKGWKSVLLTVFLVVLAIFFLAPIFLVLMNSFKGQFYISDAPFALPDSETFVGLRNYWNGIEKVGFFSAFGYSAFITVFSVAAIVLFTAMTAWYLVRIKTRTANALYYLFVFSMIVPFQMVMFTMSKLANLLRLDNPLGIILLYLGFGSGLSVFLYSGFIKSIPLDVEEAAMIDGCKTWQILFKVDVPIIRSAIVTVAIISFLSTWNEFAVSVIMLTSPQVQTISLAASKFKGMYSTDYGSMAAAVVMLSIPQVAAFAYFQKFIVSDTAAGASKG